MSDEIRYRYVFDVTPMRRAFAELASRLALVGARDPRTRWKLQYRIERIRRRRGLT